MKGDDMFDMVTLRILSFMKYPHTIDEAENGLHIPHATIYRRVKSMVSNRLLRVAGKEQTDRRNVIYVSNIERMTCLLDRNHYTIEAVFRSGDIRKETHMIRRGFY
jgi:hypothetical protein